MNTWPTVARILSAPVIASLLFCLFSAPAGAQQAGDIPAVLDVVGGNASNSRLFWLDFDEGEARQVNIDANRRVSVRSFEFFKNTCQKRVDVVAADSNGGEILLYEAGRGAGISLCSANCPTRPGGLSSSNDRLLAAVETGEARAKPEVWFYRPAACGTTETPFMPGVRGGQLSLGAQGTTVGGIADTEFVRLVGGGLDPGDLLVLTTAPATISRIKARDIAALLDGSVTTLPTAEILVPPGFFGRTRPTGLAFVPGSAGVGSVTDGTSENEDLLVALAQGHVLKLTFRVVNGEVVLAGGGQSWQNYLLPGLDGVLGLPQGIAAGTRGEESYLVVADQRLGRYIKGALGVDERTGEISGVTGVEVIQANVQKPQGVAINSDGWDATRCVDDGNNPVTTGCRIRKTIDVHFSQGLLPGGLDRGDLLFANIQFIPDPRSPGSDETLRLPGFGPDFRLPSSCRGFAVPDDPGANVLVVLDMTKNFDITPGNFVQVTELVDLIIPQLEGCKKTGARIYYHPDPDASGAFDTPRTANYSTRRRCHWPPGPRRGRDPAVAPACARVPRGTGRKPPRPAARSDEPAGAGRRPNGCGRSARARHPVDRAPALPSGNLRAGFHLSRIPGGLPGAMRGR
jgi:hypothetical protein